MVAQLSLGALLYYRGAETPQGIEWIRKAAAQQYAPAEFQMGQLFDFGFGVAQSDRKALVWYRRAAVTTGSSICCRPKAAISLNRDF